MTLPAIRARSLLLTMAAALAAIFVAGTAEADPDAPLADGALVVVSDSDCPSAEAVREELLGFRPVGEWPALWVSIRATSQMLVVEIGPQKTNPRQLDVVPDCAARATAVAVVILAWTGDLPVEAAGTPILRPATPLPQTLIPKTKPGQSEIGAGLLAATVGGTVPGVRVEFGRMRRGSGLGWRFDLTVPAKRQVVLDGVVVRWMRVSAGLGLDARWAMRRLFLDGELGGVAALTYGSGQGYVANQSDWSPTWGLAAGIRAGMPWGRARLWLDLRAVKWLFEQSVHIDPVTTGTASAANLPSLDAQAAIGISYAFQ